MHDLRSHRSTLNNERKDTAYSRGEARSTRREPCPGLRNGSGAAKGLPA